jgi:hypothetical protein
MVGRPTRLLVYLAWMQAASAAFPFAFDGLIGSYVRQQETVLSQW